MQYIFNIGKRQFLRHLKGGDYVQIYDIPGYDSAYKPIFYAYWSDYEEEGWLYILMNGTDHFILEGGHCVMTDDIKPEDIWSGLSQISESVALETMEEWKEYEEEIPNG